MAAFDFGRMPPDFCQQTAPAIAKGPTFYSSQMVVPTFLEYPQFLPPKRHGRLFLLGDMSFQKVPREKMGLWRKGKFGIILLSCPNCVQLTKWPLTTLQAHKM